MTAIEYANIKERALMEKEGKEGVSSTKSKNTEKIKKS